MPYDKKTGKHYDYTEKGIEQYKKDTGKGVPYAPFKMKASGHNNSPMQKNFPNNINTNSPAKVIASNVLDRIPGLSGQMGALRGFQTGGLAGGIMGGASGALGLTRGVDRETMASEAQYGDVLKQEGLERNFWGKLGFKGGQSSARAARIAELQEQDEMGIDRERIASRGGSTAGPA